MSVEAYTPSKVEFEGCPVDSPRLVTLYDPDGPAASGSLTAGEPIPAGRSGRLVFQGRRDAKVWSVVCPRISVTNRTAVGCEFVMSGKPQRRVIAESDQPGGGREKGFEEQFDIR
ncbi:MAG: hypothetical protein ACYSUQ_10065 [Planctomycetota bacterium]